MLSLQTLANGFATGGIYALLALSLTLIVQSSRFVNFTIGGLVATGAILGYALTKKSDWPLSLGWGLAVLCTGGISGALELTVFGPLRQRRVGGVSLMIASLGLLVAFEGILPLAFGHEPLIMRIGRVQEGISIGYVRLTPLQISCVGSALIVGVMMCLCLRYSTLAKYLRATADDLDLAEIVGIPGRKVALVAAVICGVLAGGAGILTGLEQDATPTMGFRPILMGIAGMVIGGTGKLSSAFVGAWLLGIAQQIVRETVGGGWSDGILFGFLVIMLLIRPEGVFHPSN